MLARSPAAKVLMRLQLGRMDIRLYEAVSRLELSCPEPLFLYIKKTLEWQ